VAHERVRERVANHESGRDSGRRAHEANERRLPYDHATNLAEHCRNRAQQRDLALALLDRETHRAGDDEHRDEHRQSAG
jgi:hypothetical protein